MNIHLFVGIWRFGLFILFLVEFLFFCQLKFQKTNSPFVMSQPSMSTENSLHLIWFRWVFFFVYYSDILLIENDYLKIHKVNKFFSLWLCIQKLTFWNKYLKFLIYFSFYQQRYKTKFYFENFSLISLS